ncbi:hypothetical protein [Streptomyces sp. SID2119]|nr:hypothetical protein [Streptomyces sp. SID2119]
MRAILADFAAGRVNVNDFQEAVEKVEGSKRGFAESANVVIEAMP